ncbi:MAG: hypothetical protein V3V84_07735 [Candidatus Bathyarchaeia archaeon]
MYMYLLFDQDGNVTEHDNLPDYVSWDCWPTAVKIELHAGPDHTAFRLTEGGWKEIISN